MAHIPVSFAAWVKAIRQAHDLTQDALAEQVGCARMTIAKIEAGDRRPSQQLAKLLATTLKIPPSELDAFLRLARLPAAATPVPSATTPRHNLPTLLTSFVGRAEEIASVKSLLVTSRWLTVRGPGGIGKTRLALHVAQQLLASFPDGVFFVELAALRDPDLVVPTIARILGLAEPGMDTAVEDLAAMLQAKRLLLLLDNFEQVAPAASAIAMVLAACPHLTVLVTSREALHVQGEQQYLVPPLAVPNLDAPPSLAVSDSPAVALFVARTQALQPDFTITIDNVAAIAGICARLDGLPLAIELAAARSQVLPPAALLARLDQRLALLTRSAVDVPVRHQTLRDAIAWSYDLLTPIEQRMFRRIAVFVGGMMLDAVEAVVGWDTAEEPVNASADEPAGAHSAMPTGISLLNGLESLIDKSLLRREAGEGDPPRYRMLETIREYGLEQLAASGEETEVRRVHASFFLTLAEQLAPEVPDSQEAVRSVRLERDHDNWRAAFAWWSTDPEGGAALVRLTAALGRFWYQHGYWNEGRKRLSAALTTTVGPASARGKLLFWLGSLSQLQGSYPAARRYLEQSLELATTAEETLIMAHALNGLGNIARHQGDYAAARDLYEQALICYQMIGNQKGHARILSNLGMLNLFQGNYSEARALLEESLAMRRELGHTRGVAGSLNNLGEVARAEGNYAEADRLYTESLILARELEDKPFNTHILLNLGHVALQQGDYSRARFLFCEALPLCQGLGREAGVVLGLAGLAGVGAALGETIYAARLGGAADAILDAIDAPQEPQDAATYQRVIAGLRMHCDAATFDAAWGEGRAMSAEQAIAYAMVGSA